MPFLIDGHNLIPKIRGLRLDMVDDEMQLIAMLQEFCRLRRKKVEVYFDRRSPGKPPLRNFGSVLARFASEQSTADIAIAKRLKDLGRNARNWTVVSSDQSVQAFARAVNAQTLSSEAFSAELSQTIAKSEISPEKNTEPTLNVGQVEEWLQVFLKRLDEKEKDDN